MEPTTASVSRAFFVISVSVLSLCCLQQVLTASPARMCIYGFATVDCSLVIWLVRFCLVLFYVETESRAWCILGCTLLSWYSPKPELCGFRQTVLRILETAVVWFSILPWKRPSNTLKLACNFFHERRPHLLLLYKDSSWLNKWGWWLLIGFRLKRKEINLKIKDIC